MNRSGAEQWLNDCGLLAARFDVLDVSARLPRIPIAFCPRYHPFRGSPLESDLWGPGESCGFFCALVLVALFVPVYQATPIV